MKKVSLVLSACAIIIILLAVNSCKKESQLSQSTTTSPHPQARIDDDSLENEITSFYDLIAIGGSTRTIPAANSVFLIEASYNYYCARNCYDETAGFFTFQVAAPLTNTDEITLSDASEAFYQIKDSLMSYYDQSDYDNKRLGLFDLEGSLEDDQIVYTIKASIINGPVPDNNTLQASDDVFFDEPSNHAWSVFGSTNTNLYTGISWGGGQCDINTTTHATYNITSTAPSAPQSLRWLGIVNAGPPASGFYINQSTVTMAASVISNTSSPYASILGYDLYNYDIFKTWLFTNGSCNTVDGYETYKFWLMNDQMNFYLFDIPGYIVSYTSPGKDFYDFHVAEVNCLCCFAPNTANNPYNFGDYAAIYQHYYFITSAEKTSITTSSTTLLPNM